MTLEEIRDRINQIDNQLLPLLIERLECGREVARVKQQTGGPILNPEREREILNRMESQAGDYGREIRVIYAACMEASRALQHRLLNSGEKLRSLILRAQENLPAGGHIACQGAEGAYSHQAALHLFPEGELAFSPSFQEVFESLKNGTADFGILPVENSSAGSVTDVYDLILKYRFYIAAAASVKIEHCLAAPSGVHLNEIKTVYSHPQALAQCTEYLNQNNLTTEPFSNTAAAAKMAATQGGSIGVICSQQAAETYGLTILNRNIQNSHSNCTRFIAVCREPIIPADAQKISLCFSLPHTTGSLSAILSRFSLHGLNLTKIESRPLADKNFEYDFYLDFTGNVREASTLDLIASLHEELPRFSFLGNYREREVTP
ncbi:MAG: prephenate dehydratase domain-containing protein [Clostridium sp.]|uniref:bifunctional chorismate mutase/prephenate dehydratase n=1 Tax=Clostridium sp. TaxID=1506 RepID=UPI002914C7AF|nr:prephenate dehydratase domain-containing protein [Clostridium sp.]MDU7338169.1 prephenate dehydratase domain-containing protein [Clostridium sp.]